MKTTLKIFILFILTLQISCAKKPSGTNNDKEPTAKKTNLVVLYTNDEHGWMEANENYGGAAGMYDLWVNREGYKADSFLVISGGDMWTGPAISTWFQGRSMIEVMNEMGYDVATIGNHEFDFKIEELIKNKALLNFPLIAANIQSKSSGEIPSFALPYVIEEAAGLKVGIIGLASRSTPTSTFPAFVEDYNFTSYEDAITEYVPIVKNLGADIIIVVGHIGENEMNSLAPIAKTLGVSLVTGGHTHRYVDKIIDGVGFIQSGSNLRSYMKVVIEFDPANKATKILSTETVENQPKTSSNSVQNMVDKWVLQAEDDLNVVIGYSSEPISRNTPQMENMVADSWLYAYPEADISMTNAGGIRQDIPQGNITLATIVGLLPFTNTLYELELSGEQVIDCSDNLVIGGMTTIGGYFLSDGSPIEFNTVYKVLTTDYLYSQPDSKFAKYDPEPYNTSILYMQPTVDWILSKDTDENNPINNYLDATARR